MRDFDPAIDRLGARCRFSAAGDGGSPCADAAGGRKAPRQEIAVGSAPGSAAGAMGVWSLRLTQLSVGNAIERLGRALSDV